MNLDDVRGRLFLTVSEAATILRADDRTVRRAIEAGELTAVRVSSVVRLPTAAFLQETHLDTAATEPPPGQGLSLVDDQRGPPAA